MTKVKKMTDERLVEIIEAACKKFEGNATIMESAVGALVWGRIVGWQPLRLMHSGRAYKSYERLLGITFREVLPPTTEHSNRMEGYRMVQKIGKFWQAVTSGLVPAREAQQAVAQNAT